MTKAFRIHNLHTVEIWCRPTHRLFGLLDHFYIVLNDNEHHLGFYKEGSVLPKGTTQSSHLVSIRTICHQCYLKLLIDLELREDVRFFYFYPILNCETLVNGLSVQTIFLLNLIFVPVLMWKKLYWFALLTTLIIIIATLIYSKLHYKETCYTKCIHINENE